MKAMLESGHSKVNPKQTGFMRMYDSGGYNDGGVTKYNSAIFDLSADSTSANAFTFAGKTHISNLSVDAI